MEIRTATPEDWARIIEIYNHAVQDGRSTADTEMVSVDSRRAWLEQHSEHYPLRVALAEGVIVGWCSLSPWRSGRKALAGVAEISYYVARDYRGKGYADQLMTDALSYATESGFRHLIAILIDINIASVKLLRKHGFRKWGELPGIADFGNLVCGQYIYGKKLSSGAGSSSRIAAIL